MLNMALNLSSKLKKIDNPKISLEVLIMKYASMIKISNEDASNSKASYENIPSSEKTNQVENQTVEIKEPSINNQESSEKEEPIPEILESEESGETNNENTNNKESVDKEKSFEENKLSEEDIFKTIKSNWSEILQKLDIINSKLSSFLEEATIKDFNDNTLLLILDGGNDFIKKVLDSDSKIITDIIHKNYGFSIKILIEVAKNQNQNQNQNEVQEDSIDEDHPLLDDAMKIFKGKIIS